MVAEYWYILIPNRNHPGTAPAMGAVMDSKGDGDADGMGAVCERVV